MNCEIETPHKLHMECIMINAIPESSIEYTIIKQW